MNEDFNDILSKFSEILKEKNIDINKISNSNECSELNNSQSASSSDFALDVDTILKIKDIISKLNKSQNSPRNQLLHALKPYLENDRQDKLDNYIKIANLLSVMEDMNLGISFLENKQGYDFILIITLFLLIL